MNTIRISFQWLAVIGILIGGFFTPRGTQAGQPADQPAPVQGFFIQNQGQYPEGEFLLRGTSVDYWFSSTGIRMVRSLPVEGTGGEALVTREAFDISFRGINPDARIEPVDLLPTRLNYLIGSDAAGWFTDVPVWSGLVIRNAAPGFDLVVKGTAPSGGLDWAWKAQPGSSLGEVELAVKGALRVQAEAGNLQLEGRLGSLMLELPFAEDAQKSAVSLVNFSESDGFVVNQAYAAQKQMQAPALLSVTYQFLSYLGGESSDTSYSIASYNQNAYITGVSASANFPITPGVVDTVLENQDAFVAKISSSGATIDFATFIGGEGIDRGNDIAVENGKAYVTGETNSTSFPGMSPWTNRGYELFVVKLNATGTALEYAKRFGGSDVEEDFGYGIAVEGGYAYITGATSSADFADQTGLICGGFSTAPDIAAIKLNQNGTTAWIKCIGGKNVDAGFDITVSGGVSYITGESNSRGIGGLTFIPAGFSAFVLKVTAVGTAEWITKIDGTGTERGNGIAYDSSGNLYVVGSTDSSNLVSTLPGAPNPYGGGEDAFLVKLSSSGTPAFRTFLGGSGLDRGYGIAVDIGGGIQVIGETLSTDFPVTADAHQPSLAGGKDAFIARLLPADATPLKYSSYLGGSDSDGGRGMAIDLYGYTLISGETSSTNLPVTAGVFQPVYGGAVDAFVGKLPLGPVPAVVIKKYTNEIDADLPPGPYVAVGSTVTWRYEVTNVGTSNLNSIAVSDNRLGAITCPKTSLTPGETMNCTRTGTAVSGQYANIATVNGTSQTGLPVSDTDASHYFGANPATSLVKYTNSQDANSAPGIVLESGSTVTWTYEITNSGNVELANINVVDDNGTPANPADDVIVCQGISLAAGASTTCTLPGTATPGQYANLAVVTGTPPGGLAAVTDNDPSHYFGSAPALSLVKKTNGTHYDAAPGLYIPVGGALTWSYEVKNTGNVTLTNVIVEDDMGPNPTQTICTIASLAPNATQTCSKTGSAAVGQYTNVATVSGTPPVGSLTPVQDTSYYFGVQANVSLEFMVNGSPADTAPGVYLPAGSGFTWGYQVTNNSNVPYTDVAVKDDNGTPSNPGDDITVCNIPSLEVGASQTCTRAGTAVVGAFNASATITGNLQAGLAPTATDPAYTFGAQTTMTVLKKTNGYDVSSAPGVYVLTGSTVNWTYLVTNTGNVELTGVGVVDDNGTPGNTGDDVAVCSNRTVAAGQQTTCNHSASAKAGAYSNIATASGTPPGGLPGINASDASFYTGVTPGILLEKKTNGEDAATPTGPLVLVGSPITWSYKVSNTGDIALSGISIKDDNGTPTNTSDDVTFCSITSLAVGANQTCTREGTAAAGQYANIAIVTASPPTPLSAVTSQDTSHYFGVIKSVSLVKSTNGQDANSPPGPNIRVGNAVNWTYLVTNTGNVALTSVLVSDDKGVTISCPNTTLAPLANMTCTASGIAVAGQYSNIGTVTAQAPSPFGTVTSSDPSHYFGSFSVVTLVKYTNGQDANDAPGPYILVGGDITWEYVVTNAGNDILSGIQVTDNKGVTITCPSTSLNPGASMTCTATGKAVAGQYSNIGTVTANPPGGLPPISDTDPSHYFGANPSIQLVKKTNGEDANTAPGPYIPVGGAVAWDYNVENTGNVELTSVQVTDDQGLQVSCPGAQLAAGTQMNCTASGTAGTGPYANIGSVRATAAFGLGEVQDSDASHYFGFYLGVTLKKQTNGMDIEAPPGPKILAGTPVKWTYDVKNLGNAPTNITVTDNKGVSITCPKLILAPDELMRCTAQGVAVVGEYANIGTAVAELSGTSLQVIDSSYYTGIEGYNLFLPVTMR